MRTKITEATVTVGYQTMEIIYHAEEPITPIE